MVIFQLPEHAGNAPMYHLFEIYPEHDSNKNKPLYFLEFIQFSKGDPIRWKLYKRSFIFTEEELERQKKADHNNVWMLCNEGHPYALLEDTLHPDGCIPDKKWLQWMVDSLNLCTSRPS